MATVKPGPSNGSTALTRTAAAPARIERRGLVDVEKVPSGKGPPRKVYSLNAQGQEYLEESWRTWSFLTERLEQLREGGK